MLSGALYAVVARCEPAMISRTHRHLSLLVYVVAIAGLFACYGAVLRATLQMRSPAARVVVFGAPLIFQLGWLFVPPTLSIDLLSYIADGYLWRLGMNPYLHATREIAATSYAAGLAVYGWRPVHGISPYGPLWMLFEIVIGRASLSVAATILLMKAVALSANVMVAATIYATVDAGPEGRLAAMTLYWWNPVPITEFSGEGHNDALMVLPVILGLYWITRRQSVRGVVAVAAAVLVKYLPALFGGPVLVYLWRTSERRRFVHTLLVAAPLVILLAACAYAPLWAGRETFLGVRLAGRPAFGPGTSGALFWVVAKVVGSVRAVPFTALASAAFLLVVVTASSLRVCDRETLFGACATVALAYVLVATPRYWPWYVVMPTALFALSPTRTTVMLVLVLTICAKMVAPLDIVRVSGALSWPAESWATTVFGVWVPLVFWIGTLSAGPALLRPTATSVDER